VFIHHLEIYLLQVTLFSKEKQNLPIFPCGHYREKLQHARICLSFSNQLCMWNYTRLWLFSATVGEITLLDYNVCNFQTDSESESDTKKSWERPGRRK